MNPSNIDEFIEDVVSYIKFPFVRGDIRDELRGHILDKKDYYIGNGYESEEAEEEAIRNMGEAKTIGKELNKQHNPFVGWFLKISNVFIVLFTVMVIFNLGIYLSMGLFSRSLLKEIPKEDVVYRLDIDEKVKIDDRVIHFTNLIYDKNGDMSIFYKDYVIKPWGTGWSLGTIGLVSDDLGNEYMGYSGSSSGGYVSKNIQTMKDFSNQANTLIIEYDEYNRYYRVEIPLKEGDLDE